jgi:hypothetical protein
MNDEKLQLRTIAIIENGGRILLRWHKGDRMYLHQHTNIASGPDEARWTFGSHSALEIFNLKWAHTLAHLYNCKVVVAYPKKKSLTPDHSVDVGDRKSHIQEDKMSDEQFAAMFDKATKRLKELRKKKPTCGGLILDPPGKKLPKLGKRK